MPHSSHSHTATPSWYYALGTGSFVSPHLTSFLHYLRAVLHMNAAHTLAKSHLTGTAGGQSVFTDTGNVLNLLIALVPP